MVFSSLVFLCIFFPISFIVYFLIPSIKYKNAWLIIISLLFYAYGEPIYVFLMIGSTFINFILGLYVKENKIILSISVIINLLILGIFKYSDMIVVTCNSIFQTKIPEPNIDLPIGISFFTFQIMSYVIDVYRGETNKQKNFWKLLLYISLFPQLIAGPIVKYHDIEAQISDRKCSLKKVSYGLRRFILGLSKKVLISNIAAITADKLFSLHFDQINCIGAWIGAISYTIQIYFDFSGYSDMAIGMGKMFGFDFLENFNYPYESLSVKEFWRRWHISLSTWFKEYVYIPLGGNRKGKLRTCINKLVVFFLTGLWHGANWTFVVWGLFHGMFLLFEEFVNIKKLPRILGHIYTMLVVICGFVIFRSDTILQALTILKKMFIGWNMSENVMNITFQFFSPLTVFIIIIGVLGGISWKNKLIKKIYSKNNALGIIISKITYIYVFILLVLCILNLSSGTYNPFIYFRF